MSDRQDNPPSHPRRRAVVPPFLPPRGGGIDRPARPSVAGRRGSTPPFAPQTRQAAPAPSQPGESEPHIDDVMSATLDLHEDVVHSAPESILGALATESTEPVELTDWLEEDDFAAERQVAPDESIGSAAELQADQIGTAEPAAEWPKETWHGDPWSDPGAESTAAAPSEHSVDSAAPVTPFEFAAEFPEPEAFTSGAPPLSVPDSPPEPAPYMEAQPATESHDDAAPSRPPWVPPTVEPIAESSELLSRYATRPEAGEGDTLDRLKEIEPWAMAPSTPSSSAEDAVAAALERIARRIRDGEVVLPPESASTTDEAALALTLAALLRTPPKG